MAPDTRRFIVAVSVTVAVEAKNEDEARHLAEFRVQRGLRFPTYSVDSAITAVTLAERN